MVNESWSSHVFKFQSRLMSRGQVMVIVCTSDIFHYIPDVFQSETIS